MRHVLRKLTSWPDFQARVARSPTKQQGDCFELLAKYFFLIDPTYRTKLKHVWLLKEVPPKIWKHLNLPSHDEGIDLIAETKDGEYWAIQCKYRSDETGSLTRGELSTFTDLAFGVCKHVSLGLVCTTTNRFSRKLKLHGDRLEFCAGDVWRALGSDFFRQLRRLLGGKSVQIAPKRPRLHQQRAIRNAVKFFVGGGNSRGKLISPCATGKSLTGYWIAEALNARTVLVAVPSLALIKQSLSVWANEAVANGKQINWICVCSDEGVARNERDDAVVHVQDLGVRVHTDSTEIKDWLRKLKKGTTVVFTTYQSGKAIAQAAKAASITFDVGILDESHNTVGKRVSLFSHLLYEENIQIKKRIFMTATERRYAGRSEDVISMDDPAIYGETFELLSFKEALDCQPQILSDYRIITIAVTRTEVAELVEKNLFVRPDKGRWSSDVEAEMLAAAIALRKATQTRPIKHVVSFHSSIARARAFQSVQEAFGTAFPRYKRLDTFHVSGVMPTAVRSRTMQEYEYAKRALITNARCLTEGVDVPSIDCVLFADPRNSTVDIVQAVGRALRTAKGKKLGYVIIPVLADKDGDVPGIIQGNGFDSVLMVLRALAANDERIIEYFRTVAVGRKRRCQGTRFEIEVPDGLVIDVDEFVTSIELKFWSRLAKLSWRPFEDARAFVWKLGLRGATQWAAYCKGQLEGYESKPNDIPVHPPQTYGDKGWAGWGDWLGTGTVAPQLRHYRPFRLARSFVRRLALRSAGQWTDYCKGELPGYEPKPSDIPADPRGTYRNKGWVSMGNWLGTGTVAPSLQQFRPFKMARTFARRLSLLTSKEWRLFCENELPGYTPKPIDIPASPQTVYRDKGWTGWGDWLGTAAVGTHYRHHRPFVKARAVVRQLGLRSHSDWRKYCKGELPGQNRKPDDIPANPRDVYKSGSWAGWGDWLGTGTVASHLRRYRPFVIARAFARRLALRNREEWLKYCRSELPGYEPKPDDVPSNPQNTYKDRGWISWGDWLGTGNVARQLRQYQSFTKARSFARKLGLKSGKEWRRYCKGELPGRNRKPNDIPNEPSHVYRDDGWAGMGDWLGTGSVSPQLRQFRPFGKARVFLRHLGLASQREWLLYLKGELPGKGKKPADIPASPQTVYRDKGWAGWGDWLGTGTVAPQLRKFRSFKEARAFVRRLGLRGRDNWIQYCRSQLQGHKPKPDDIPTVPCGIYKNKGWIGWSDWLGTESKLRRPGRKHAS